MKARSDTELADRLDANLQRRKHELSSLKLLVERERGRAYGSVVARAALPLLYAHLEGFVKFAANAYIEYVNRQGPKYADLIPSLVGLAMRGKITEAQQSEYSHAGRTKLIEFVFGNFTDKAELPLGRLMGNADDKDAVSTSNLSWKVLADILGLLGLKADAYETKKVLLEERLLAKRNGIAHGDLMAISADDYVDLHEAVIEILVAFHNDVLNAAAMQGYLRATLKASGPQP